MSVRRILLVLSLLVFATIGGLLIRGGHAKPEPNRLAEPLSAEEAVDMASAMPAIDEIRSRNGSVLDGTLLDSLDDPAQHIERDKDSEDFVQMLRREARRLDEVAADQEDSHNFADADALRDKARAMRETARGMHGFQSITVNR